MKNSAKSEIIGAIDVGSHALRMKIVEIKAKEEFKTLEMVRQPVSLGRDTFAMGKVSFETVNKTCNMLKGFKQLMTEYNIQAYRAVATSAIREAQNRSYIIDQIKLKTELDIDVIDTSEERFLTYKSIRKRIQNDKALREEGVMIVDIGSGSMQVSIYSHHCLTFSQNIKIGSLRVREMLSSLEGRTLNFSKILEEYIAGNIDRLKIFQAQEEEVIKHFIAIGVGISTIARLCNDTVYYGDLRYISREKFEAIYQEILYKSGYAIGKEYNISLETADLLLPSMMIFKKFLDTTIAQGLIAPLISLTDGIIMDIADKRFDLKQEQAAVQDIVSSVRVLAKRYRYDQAHAEDVERKSLMIFDALKKLHGLGNRERFLLQLSAILHDIGKFINMTRHYIHSYEIIMASDLIGITKDELEIIANVARYHSKVVPANDHPNFRKLSEKNRVVVAKLVAIIRIADGLDRSHRQKIKDIKITVNEKEIIIKVDALEDIVLEKWTVETKAEFFQEVFGITPIVKVKRKR